MSAIQQQFAVAPAHDPVDDRTAEPVSSAMTVWIACAMPAELVGAAATVIGGVLAAQWTDAPVLVALAALVTGTAGFCLVIAVTVLLDQLQLTGDVRQAASRAAVRLPAQFGAPRLLDMLVVRPAALILGVWVIPDPMWGLLAGLIVAGIVHHTLATRVRARR